MKLPNKIQNYLLAKLDPMMANRVKAAEQRAQDAETWRAEVVTQLNEIHRICSWNNSLMTQEELARSKEYQQNRLISHFYARYGLLAKAAGTLRETIQREKL